MVVSLAMSEPDVSAIKACLSKISTLSSLVLSVRKQVDGEYILTSKSDKRTRELAKRYEEIRIWISTNFSDIGLQMPSFSIPSSLNVENAFPILENVILGCSVAEGGLADLLKPRIEPEVLDRLGSIRKELDMLEREGFDLRAVKDLKIAINEAEQAHYLASAMISSRVIQYIVNNIPGEEDKQKIQYLIDNFITPSERKDEQGQMITAMRLSRNYLSHRIGLIPDPGEALMLLGGAFKLSKIFLLLKENL